MKGKRLAVLFSGAVICLFIGLIYAWSIFVAPLETELGWTRAQTSATFTVSMISFCIAGMVSGALIQRCAPRRIVLTAAALFLAGFSASSRIGTVLGLYVSYGVLCGAGVGLAYNAVLSCVSKWFPEKTGVVSGVLLMCFGFGGMALGSLASSLIALLGWRTTFLVFAVLFAAILAGFSLMIRPPREDELDSAVHVSQKKSARQEVSGVEMTAGQMLRRVSFWLYFLWAVVLSAAGLAVIGNASMCAREIGASTRAAAAITGMLSICNGIGRILVGLIFDRFGRKISATYANALLVAAMLLITLSALIHSVGAFVVGGVILGLGYGSVPPLNAAFVNQYYGAKHYALNFSLMNLNLIPASLLGPLAAGVIQTATGSYLMMYIALAAACAVVYLTQLLIKRP